MTVVNIIPMPEKFRKIPKKWRPVNPPVFIDCGPDGPTAEDRQLARELFALLDPESQEWYRRCGGLFKDL